MAQFDVHRNPEPATRDRVPYVVDLQSDLLADLPTRLVAPLRVRDETMKSAPRRLCPSFEVRGVDVVMYPHDMAGIPAKLLGRLVASLRASSAVRRAPFAPAGSSRELAHRRCPPGFGHRRAAMLPTARPRRIDVCMPRSIFRRPSFPRR